MNGSALVGYGKCAIAGQFINTKCVVAPS